MKLKVGDKEYEVDNAVGMAFKKMRDELKAKMKKMDEIQTDLLDRLEKAGVNKNDDDEDSSKKENMKLVAKVDALQKEIKELNEAKNKKDSDNEFMKKVAEFSGIMEFAKKNLKEDSLKKLDGLDTVGAIKRAIVEDQAPEVSKEKLDNEHYVEARFDMLKENTTKKIDEKENLGNKIIENKLKNKQDKADEKVESYDTADDIRKRNLDALQDETEKRFEELNS